MENSQLTVLKYLKWNIYVNCALGNSLGFLGINLHIIYIVIPHLKYESSEWSGSAYRTKENHSHRRCATTFC